MALRLLIEMVGYCPKLTAPASDRVLERDPDIGQHRRSLLQVTRRPLDRLLPAAAVPNKNVQRPLKRALFPKNTKNYRPRIPDIRQ
jgi:hypothetical protein